MFKVVIEETMYFDFIDFVMVVSLMMCLLGVVVVGGYEVYYIILVVILCFLYGYNYLYKFELIFSAEEFDE